MDEDVKVGVKRVSAQEGLKMLGWDLKKPQRGRVLVRTGICRSKHYSARYRIGDGHLLFRWGRLTGAELTYVNGRFSHVCFDMGHAA